MNGLGESGIESGKADTQQRGRRLKKASGLKETLSQTLSIIAIDQRPTNRSFIHSSQSQSCAAANAEPKQNAVKQGSARPD
jgi:hypothetical protein